MRQNYYNLSVVSLTKIKNNRKFVYSDEQLIAEFQSGDELAYIELVNRYRNRLLNFVFQILGDSDISEDIIQDTFLRLYEKKHYYKKIAKFSTWIYTIARNLANTELRKKIRRKTSVFSQISKHDYDYELPSSQPDVSQEFENDYVGKRIQKAINQLQDPFKEVIILRDMQNLSYDDISLIIDVPIGTVKSRINRARLQLQIELKDLK